MDNEAAIERVRRYSRQSLRLAAMNAAVVAFVILWCIVVWMVIENPLWNNATDAWTLPVVWSGLLAYLVITVAGTILAGRGLFESKRTPGNPYIRRCIVSLACHVVPTAILVLLFIASAVGF